MNTSTKWSFALSAAVIASTAGTASAQVAWAGAVDLFKLHARATGQGVLVGQIELGTARVNHVALDAGTPGSKVPFIRSVGGANQNDDHATQVASLISGRTGSDGGAFTGAAPDSKLAISNWVNPGNTPTGWEDNWLGAMTDFFRVAPTTPVLSTSAGWSHGAGTANQRLRMQQVADWMGDTGYLFCVLAGNSGPGASTEWSPSGGYNVLSVGATGQAVNLQNYNRIANFSSRGNANDGGGSRMKPDLVAPGTRILSALQAPDGMGAFNRFGEMDSTNTNWVSGTSFATPIVAGISACLYEWGQGHALSTDPRVMRAVMMNSTSKAVENDAGTRWDMIPGLGQGANSISPDLGTGQIDAGQAWEQYRAGQTHVNPVSAGLVPQLGFDFSSTSSVGVGPSYMTATEVRRGSYMTSTLCWNRGVNSGYNANDGTNNWDNWNYATLNNLDIFIARPGGAPILQQSNATDGTSEHSVFKAPDRNQFVWRIDSPTVTPSTSFGFAWEYISAPTYTKDYNGCFTGNSHGNYLEDGWYRNGFGAQPAPTIAKPAWAPNDNDAWALKISSSVEAAQELWNPLDTFTVSFKYGFSAANNTLFWAYLGNINLFEAAGLGGSVTPDATNTGMYKMFTVTLNRGQLMDITGNYTELRFLSAGGPDDVFIDCVMYVPAPGAMGLTLAGMLIGARRRRAG